jgi:NAD(P)-dependent dehydrogenase (short-subunit alcohol dehydrogenase family)
MPKWTAADIPDQSGRLAVVTGANSGLGFFTTRELARAGAHVVATARDVTRGDEAASRIRASTPAAQIEVERLDLADLGSVRAFAEALQPSICLRAHGSASVAAESTDAATERVRLDLDREEVLAAPLNVAHPLEDGTHNEAGRAKELS